MSWIVLSCIPPFLWAFNNIFDEYLSKSAFAKAGALLVYLSALLDVFPAFLFAALFPYVLDVEVIPALAMMGLGGALVSSFVPYMFAIQKGNAGNAVPIYQTIPVFVFVLGFVFLGETATFLQVASGLLIITASILVGYDFETKSVNHQAVLLMLVSSSIIAVFSVISKYFINE